MYYILEIDTFPEPRPYRTRRMGWNKDLDDGKFIIGEKVSETFDKPFEFELWEYDEGSNGLAEFNDEAFPLMSDSLIEALKRAGVDNLQTFPAILRNIETTFETTEYKVVNVLGKLQAADMDASDYIDMGGTGLIAVGFKDLVIDESKANNRKMFRLAESITDVIIHESVKSVLEKCGFKYLRYLPCDG